MLTSLVATALFALLPVCDDAPPRRLANPWAGWVTGSWVSLEIDNTLAGKMTTRQSLVAVDDERYTLDERTEYEGGENEQTLRVSLARFGYPHALPSAQQVATETLRIGGREFDCAVWRARFEEDGQTWDSVAWVSPEVPHPLRIKIKAGMSLELEVASLADYVTIARRKFECVRYDGFISENGKRSPVTQWRSSEIPGGLAKSVSRVSTPAGKATHSITVKAFRGTKRR